MVKTHAAGGFLMLVTVAFMLGSSRYFFGEKRGRGEGLRAPFWVHQKLAKKGGGD